MKPVEVYHIGTNETLRIFQSVKDAGSMLGVSQGGISQTCNGIKPECYGLGWRFYFGPHMHNCKIIILVLYVYTLDYYDIILYCMT